MSKKSRGFQPKDGSSSGGSSSGDEAHAASASRSEQRKKERSRSRARTTTSSRPASSGPGIWDRYKAIIVSVAVVVGVGVVGVAIFSGATAAPYECQSLLTPAPDQQPPDGAAGPVASAEPEVLVGFVVEDLGRGHRSTGSSITYRYCPPASGPHWAIAGRAPLRRAIYGSNDSVSPGNWVHNLEHGYSVIAYQGDPPAADMAGIREVFDSADQNEAALRCGIPNKVVAVPFDDMSEPYAVIAWDRVLMLPEWDTERAMAFVNQWTDAPQAPEQGIC